MNHPPHRVKRLKILVLQIDAMMFPITRNPGTIMIENGAVITVSTEPMIVSALLSQRTPKTAAVSENRNGTATRVAILNVPR